MDLSSANLSPEDTAKLQGLINEFSDVFAETNAELGRTSLIQHSIDTGDARPVRCSPYRGSPQQRDVIDTHVQEMLDANIIEPSTSAWGFPVVLVRKRTNDIRFCVDYRRLNSVTKRDSFPLPNISDSLDLLGGARYFLTLDLKSGYWQIALDPKTKDRTAFATHGGLYEFNVLPFGLSNAGATCQRLMQLVLRGLQWKTVLLYLDDIIVFARSPEEHLSRLREVFERLREANIKVKPSKCHFA